MTKSPLRVGMIGLGAIGQGVHQIGTERFPDELVIVGALVKNPGKQRPESSPKIVSSLSELLSEDPDVVVEAAGHEGLIAFGSGVLRSGRDLYFVAVGALADPEFEAELRQAAIDGESQARIVSGALGALDAISAASIAGISNITHTSRKPPATLLDSEDAGDLSGPVEIFRGTARSGALEFPESFNVAAAASWAAGGLEKSQLRVFVDPAVNRNMHEVVVEGEFGNMRFEIANRPSKLNPKTGGLVPMSIVHQLLMRRAPIVVG